MNMNKALMWLMVIVASWVAVWLAVKSLAWIWYAASQTLAIGMIALGILFIWNALRSVKSSNEIEV